MKSFIVNSKDLFNKKKNPGLKLSARSILKNKEIQKYNKKGFIEIPKCSNQKGFTDEGVSSNIGKPSSFKYSERFLKKWYRL